MTIFRSSDTLSRCDVNHYSSIYDIRNHPNLKKNVSSTSHPFPKDSIENLHAQLKNVALSRLKRISKPTNSDNGPLRIGRYLFLAVALPPYFPLIE